MNTITDTMTDLHAVQEQLEEDMRSLGIERFRSQIDKARQGKVETNTPAVRALLSRAHQEVVEGLQQFLDECRAGGASKNGSAFQLLKDIDLDLAAHLGLRSVLDSISSRDTLSNASIRAGTLIENELHYAAFKSQDKKGFHHTAAKAKKGVSMGYKVRHMREVARKKGIQFRDWSREERLRVGAKVIEVIEMRTGLVARQTLTLGARNSPIILVATDKTVEWIEKNHERLECMTPTFLPTVVPPKPWDELTGGGYHTDRVRELTLVKTRARDKASFSPLVAAAVNAVQDTPWRINRRVFDVVTDLYERGITLSIIPSPDKLDMPAKPVWLTPEMKKEDMNEAQMAEFLAWKRNTAQVWEENARTSGRRISFLRKLWVARKFVDFERMYFPHTLDFRGRIYPVPLYLHPQSDDLSRGLLEFADGHPIGNQDGVMWLAAHGAGCWGVDKVSFAQRYAWVREHEADILACAEDPLSNVFWATAEKPWTALAFCYEWAGFVREGLDFVSHLPVQMDGSCNGLQHFSAMLRDPVGGAAVNLVPGDKPSDIYAAVAKVVNEMVERDVTSDDEDTRRLAKGWLGNVTRKVTKRPVMTLAYGAKKYGFSQMVFDDTVSPWRISSPETFPWEGNGWDASQYMAGLIWEAVGAVVVAARDAMQWLQECAKVCNENGVAIDWMTPDGFAASQRYILLNNKRLELLFNKAVIRLSVDVGREAGLDKHKQVNGIAPNFVHSLDAAHLRKTVVAAVGHGITAFSLIHDSYGTHACNCGELARLLREEFFLMYDQNDVLMQFRDHLWSYLPEGTEMPELPAMGTLRLSQVLESAFFFA